MYLNGPLGIATLDLGMTFLADALIVEIANLGFLGS